MTIRVDCASTIGPRDHNDDNGFAMDASWFGRKVVVVGVCDGLGESKHGGRAAAEITRELAGVLAYLPPVLSGDDEGNITQAALEKAVRDWYATALAHLESVAETENLVGLATTLAACLGVGDRLVVWWLGDSRVYLFRDGRLRCLTTDHSLVEAELRLPEEVALEHPDRNVITRFVKPSVRWEPEIRLYDWRDGDVLLAVSDGISASCRSWELEACVAYWLAADVSPGFLCETLLRYVDVNLRDNATVALAIRGIPKPYSAAIPTVELTNLVTRQMRDDLVRTLNDFPPDAATWSERTEPPWRLAQADLLSPGVLRSDAEESVTAGADAVCLHCGTLRARNQGCPVHGSDGVYSGRYFEVREPSGKRWWQAFGPDEDEVSIGRRGSGASLEINDEFASAQHLRVHISGETMKLVDTTSDNGTWLGVREIDLEASQLHRGVVLRIGMHQIVLRTIGK